MMNAVDLVHLPIPDGLYPSADVVIEISTFWFLLSTLPHMNYKQLSESLVTFLYNSGYKVVKLENKDLQ